MAKRFKQIVEETLDLIEGRMNQLAMDMDELSDSEFKAKHKKSKQHMSTALNKPIKPSKEEQVDEEVEQVDEGERAKEMQAGWELLRKRKKDNEKAVKDMKGMAPHMKNPALGEEVEELDELSQDKLMQYRSAAKKQGTGIQDRMKVGGGDWSKDGKDTKTLKKRMSGYKMAGRKVNPGLAATAGKAPRVAANEEVEQLDEILPVVAAVAGRALATRAVGAGASAMTKRVAGAAGSYAGKKLANKVTSTNTSTNTTKEETEDDMVKRLKSNMKKRDAYLKSKHGGLAKIGSENKKEKEDHVDIKSVREESEQIDEFMGKIPPPGPESIAHRKANTAMRLNVADARRKARLTKKKTTMEEFEQIDEELGKENEWGTNALRKRFAAATPGQESLTGDKIPEMDVFKGTSVKEEENLHEISALGAKKRAEFQAKIRKTLSDPKRIAKAKKAVAKKKAVEAEKPKNLLHQLHKTQSLDNHQVHFHSGEKVAPHPGDVRKFMNKYHSLKSPIEKEAFTNRAHKSHADFKRTVNEECNQCEMENNGVNPRYDDVMNAPEGGRIDDYDIVQLEHDVMSDIEGLTWEDMVDQYEDDELVWVDDPILDGGEGEEEASAGEISKLAYHATQMQEAITPQGRLKKRFAAIRTKSRRTMARNLALKRVSSPDRLKKRAVRSARNMVYKRLLRGRDRSTMSAAEKTRVEAMVKRFAPMVARLTVRLMPQERKIEQKRLVNRAKRGQKRKR